jgi:hypothetical protein
MRSSTSNSEDDVLRRRIPNQNWAHIASIAAIFIVLITASWELWVRHLGYIPTLNDDPFLWSSLRDKVKDLTKDDMIIIGSSRGLYDLRLDVLKQLSGREPLQLAILGSDPKAILENLVKKTDFKGSVIVDVYPLFFFSPSYPKSAEWLKIYQKFNPSQRVGVWLGIILQEHLAFIRQEDLTLNTLLENLNIPNRADAKVPMRNPAFMYTLDFNRQGALNAWAAYDKNYQDGIKASWKKIFSDRSASSQETIDGLIGEYVEMVEELKRRGGRVIFIRPPSSGWLLEKENSLAPRTTTWDLLLKRTGAAGFYFEDYPEQRLNTSEWSHLNKEDSYLYTNSLAPLLKDAMK